MSPKQSSPLENKNPLTEQEMINYLRQNGYITDVEKYADLKKVLEIPLEKFPKEIQPEIMVLRKLIEMPIMRDSIEELVTDEKRKKIWNDLHKKDPALASFYKDKNKLQASYLALALDVIFRIGKFVNFSDKIKSEFEKLKLEISGEGEFITKKKYVNELNNEQKVDAARQLTALAEDVILESVIK